MNNINTLQAEIKLFKEKILGLNLALKCMQKELQEKCYHENVVELPATLYSGIAQGHARRFCIICRLEESDNNGFQKLIKTHKILNDINNAVRLAEYMEIKDDNIR